MTSKVASLPFRQLVLASGNAGKLAELQAMLGDEVEVLPQSRFLDEEVEETGLTFIENAILKARHAARASGLPRVAKTCATAAITMPSISTRMGICTAIAIVPVSRRKARTAQVPKTAIGTSGAHRGSQRTG